MGILGVAGMTNGTNGARSHLRPGRAGRVTIVAAAAVLVPATALGTGRAEAGLNPAREAVSASAAAGIISTVAGGVGGPAKATNVSLLSPCGVSYAFGFLHIGDGLALRRVNPQTDWLKTPAGNGIAGPVIDGLLATGASIDACAVVFDQSRNAVFTDGSSGRVRVVAGGTGTFYGQAMTAGHIYTVAGGGTGGDGGPATQASLDFPFGVALDRAGNLVIADYGHNRVRVVAVRTARFYGRAMTAGDIYTVAGNGSFGFSGDGGPATKAQLDLPDGVAVDGAGNLLIADSDNNRIRVVAARTGTLYGQAMTAGDIYTVAGNGGTGPLGDGGPATQARLAGPRGVAVDRAGNLLIADSIDNRSSTVDDRIRVVAVRTGTFYGQAMTAGDIYTVAGNGSFDFSGDGGPAIRAGLNVPFGVAVDGAGNLLIADFGNRRVRVVAASTGTFYGQAMTAHHIYTVAGNGVVTFSGDGGQATKAQLYEPHGVTVDRAGNWVIADTFNNRIRVVAARTGTFYGQAMIAGHIYTVVGNGTQGFSGNGGPATKAALFWPYGARADPAGNLVIADTNNNRIRVVAARTGTFYGRAMTAGHIYIVAGDGTPWQTGDGGPAAKAGIRFPGGVAFDPVGNLVIAGGYGSNRVRLVAVRTGTFYGVSVTAGDIYTVAGGGTGGDGGPATQAELANPSSVAVDRSGNLLICDTIHDRIRVVAASTGTFYGQAMTVGDIYTVAGNGSPGFIGDGGPATAAGLTHPGGVAVDRAGNLLIGDTHSNRVRVVAASTGTFYGVSMTAGDIYTVAGGGKGRMEDGGPATGARLLKPMGVAAGSGGSLVIADTDNDLIRAVTG